MATSPRTIDESVLLSQNGWVRALAYELVGDASRRDDVVQETWSVALERPPASLRPCVLRRWLETVLRNVVRRGYRSEAARRWHERQAVDGGGDDSPDIDARLELEARLAEALRALEEPYREAVVLRYLDGLTTREVARRQETSEANARQRLSRGIAKLRARLDGPVPERGSWRALCFTAFGAKRALAPASEVLWMATKLKLVLVLIALAGLGWWWLPEREQAGTPPALAAPVQKAETRPARGARESLAGALEREPAEMREWTVDRERDLHGVVVDGSDEPVSGARLSAFDAGLQEIMGWPRPSTGHGEPLATEVADEQGRFKIPLAPGVLYDLRAQSEGFAATWVLQCVAGEQVSVRLSQRATLEGRILDAGSGEGLAGARVHVGPSEPFRLGARFRVASATSGESGAYRIEGLPAQTALYVSVEPGRGASPPELQVCLRAGQTTRRDLSVDLGRVVEGQVTDADTGAPLAGAEVRAILTGTLDRSVLTDGSGHFRFESFPTRGLEGLSGGNSPILSASAPDHPARFEAVELSAPGSPVQVIDFVLERGARVGGRVLAPDGTPIDGARIVVQTLGRRVQRASVGAVDRRVVQTDAAGHFEARGLPTDLSDSRAARLPARIALQILSAPFAPIVVELPTPREAGERIDLGDLVLPHGGTLRGVVVDREGRAQARASVSVTVWTDERMRWRPAEDEPSPLVDGLMVTRTVRSDDLGRFNFTQLPPGRLSLRAYRLGIHAEDRQTLELAEGELRDDLRLVLDTGESIAGRVIDPGGRGVAFALVLVREVGGSGGASVSTDAFGAFRAEGLAAGEYSVMSFAQLGQSNEFLNDGLQSVAAGTQGLELVLPRVAALRGRVLDAQGEPVARVRIECASEGYWRGLSAITDEHGRFHIDLAEGVRFDLVANPDGAREVRIAGVEGGADELLVHLP